MISSLALLRVCDNTASFGNVLISDPKEPHKGFDKKVFNGENPSA